MNYWIAAIFSLGVGFLAQVGQGLLDTAYLNTFLSENLITLLVALLAVNSATLGIVLTKIRDLVDKYDNQDVFSSAQREMLLSIKEQIVLIVLAVVFLTMASSDFIAGYGEVMLLLESCVVAVFVYALTILYDTAKSIFILLDFDG